MLAVDQFEETFTACRDERGAQPRSSPSSCAPRQGGDGVVVLAIRADFYGRCAAYPELARLLAANQVLVGAMRHDELRRGDRRARRARRPASSSRSSPTRSWTTSRTSPARCRCSRRRCSSCGSGATGAGCGSAPTRRPAACAARSRGSRRTRSRRLDAAQQALARRVLLRLAEVEPRGRRGAPPPAARRARRRRRRRRVGHRAARRRAPADRQRRAASSSRTRRCCASGRGCATGSRRIATTSGSTGA